MLPYRHLLVGTDFSEPALEAVRVAARMAETLEARISLLHVMHPVTVPSRVAALEEQLGNERARQVAERLEEIARRELGRVRCELRGVAHASPPQALCELAAEWGADLCVVGTHGRTGPTRLLLGSVAERVVRHAPCDVLVARATRNDRGCIVAPFDFSPGCEVGLERARSLARRLDVRLELLHVYDDTVSIVAEDGRSFVSTSAMTERIGLHLGEVRRAYFGDDDEVSDTVVVSRNVPEAIARHAADHEAALVVTGTHGRTGASRFFIGSVAERTARLAPCSVLVVRAPSEKVGTT